MRCPKCESVEELRIEIDLEQWEDTAGEHDIVSVIHKATKTECINCRHSGVAEDFGLTTDLIIG